MQTGTGSGDPTPVPTLLIRDESQDTQQEEDPEAFRKRR